MPITAQELGRRLRAAREACSLKQEDVAGYLGLSRSTITQMELGNRTVSSLELERLACMFGRDIRDFVAPSFDETDALSALFRSNSEVTGTPEVLEKVRECITIGRELNNVEKLLGIETEVASVATYPHHAPSTRWEAINQGERVADEERRRLGLGMAPVPEMAELIEQQGVRTGLVDLPDDVSGLTIGDSRLGFFVVANRTHHFWRRRFSFAHEYGHLLMDRASLGIVSHSSRSGDLVEVRANSFAACFLMPTDAVMRFIASLGKGKQSRAMLQVYDEHEALVVEGRKAPHSQDIQLYDVVQMAATFGVSVLAAMYRLRNLRLLTDQELAHLKEEDQAGKSRAIARLLGLPDPDHQVSRNEFRRRFIGLGLDAYRRELISTGKLRELARLVDASDTELNAVLDDFVFGGDEGDGCPF